ncbi:MAG: BamA/TamA family outer membrane protein [Chitinophagales bacterium]|nr:BamA/TamA family outer membrane protein [Chitinophagales bacterium]
MQLIHCKPLFFFLFLVFFCFFFSEETCAQGDTIPDTLHKQELFQNSDFFIVDSISISGNKKTKDYIIERELLFEQGDSIFQEEYDKIIEESVRNINNTSLFLSAQLVFDKTLRDKIICVITVQERWYVFPKLSFAIVDRNFNVWWVEQNHNLSRTEYGMDLIWYNFSGHRDNLGLRAIFGYTQKFELAYSRPHLFNKSDFGGGFAFLYANNKELAYSTENNKHVFFKDSNYVRKRLNASVHVNNRNNIYQQHLMKLKYHYQWIADTVVHLNPDYFLNGNNEQDFLSLSYTFTSNHVDDRSYPLKGYYGELQVAKIGLGIFDAINQVYFSAQYNQYWQVRNNLFLQGQLSGQFLLGTTYPYYELISLGYCENFVRGYEYYVMNGEQTYLLRTNVKMKLFDWHFKAPLINWDVFENIPVKGYVKLFSDAGYVADRFYDENNFLVNNLQYSAGAGIDITTYYDWVFRFEAAVNALGEFGLYLHAGLDLNTYEDCNIW